MKYYFKEHEEEVCYSLSYFKFLLKHENLSEIVLYEAEKDDSIKDMFYCKELQLVCEKNDTTCGKFCDKYKPRNKVSGCCKYYSTNFYIKTDKKIILK